MKTSWTSRAFLSAAALIGVVAIGLAVHSPASQATQSNLVATQVPPARRVRPADLLPEETPARSLRVGSPSVRSPHVRILQPADQTHYWYGDAIPVTLVVSAQDANHNTIPDSAIVWTDNLVGTLGIGATLQHVFLSGGAHSQHIITATAMTADGRSASDTITIEIGFTQ